MIPGIVSAHPLRPCSRCRMGGATVLRDTGTRMWFVRCSRCGHEGPRSADSAHACRSWDNEPRPWYSEPKPWWE